MIHKTIHYCWFGNGPKNNKIRKCMNSWKQYCPDYEIIEWNESNYDVYKNEYLRYCYDNKKYAFLSDYARLDIIYNHGGIYLDTDVELCASLDELLHNKFYIGFECPEYVNSGLGFGAEKYNKTVKKLLDEYSYFNGDEVLLGCPILNTRALLAIGMETGGNEQVNEEFTVYPMEYFNPYDDRIGKLNKTKNTISIHWYSKSWFNRSDRMRSKIGQIVRRCFGTKILNRLKRN